MPLKSQAHAGYQIVNQRHRNRYVLHNTASVLSGHDVKSLASKSGADELWPWRTSRSTMSILPL